MARRLKSVAAPEALPEAGELLAVEAIFRNGLIVTSEGAFVRVIQVTPPNPMILSEHERRATAEAFCHLVARLRPSQSVQFYCEARPVNKQDLLATLRREVKAFAGEPPAPGAPVEPLSLSRWRLYGAAEQTVDINCDEQAAMEFSAYVVVPYVPQTNSTRALLNQLRPGRKKLATAPLERDLKAHRRADRESLAHTDSIKSEIDALNMPTRLVNGEEVARMLWSRFNPSQADRGRAPRAASTEILGELDTLVDAEEAEAAALALRESIARSPIDFEAESSYAIVDRDAEQTIYAATGAEATQWGFLMSAMMTRQPYALSVHVHAGDRTRERTKQKMSYRRRFAVNRAAEAKGRVPDFDRYRDENEQQALLAEMAGTGRTNIYEVSLYQSLRAPSNDVAALGEAVDYCAEQIESHSDSKVNRGKWSQQELWLSTLPLGRDVACHTLKYATRNVGDFVPLIGTSCGSPSGVPFAFSDPGRQIELWNPWDRSHANGMCTVTGQSGSGKTNTLNMLLGRAVAMGARGFVLDRAGHFSTLVELLDGARQIALGADDEPWAINPWDVEDPSNVSLEKVSFLVSLHAVMMGDEGLTTLERSQLGAAIRAVYDKAVLLDDTPRESMLQEELRARADAERAADAPELAATLRNLAERLGEFCGDGAYAYLLDRETSVPSDSPLIVFDTRRVPEVVLAPVMFATLEFITRSVERHRDANAHAAAQPGAALCTARSIVAIDESWKLVSHRESGAYANDLARRSRHLGCALLVASQQLSDFDTEHGVALLRNATQHIMLSQSADEVAFAKEALRLSEAEAGVVATLKTVKGSHAQAFWVNGARGRGRVAIRLGPLEQWAYTSDPVRDAPARQTMIERCGGNVWQAIHELAKQGPPGTIVAPVTLVSQTDALPLAA